MIVWLSSDARDFAIAVERNLLAAMATHIVRTAYPTLSVHPASILCSNVRVVPNRVSLPGTFTMICHHVQKISDSLTSRSCNSTQLILAPKKAPLWIIELDSMLVSGLCSCVLPVKRLAARVSFFLQSADFHTVHMTHLRRFSTHRLCMTPSPFRPLISSPVVGLNGGPRV